MSMAERRERVLARHAGNTASADRMDVSSLFSPPSLNCISGVRQHHGAAGGGRAKLLPGEGGQKHEQDRGGGPDPQADPVEYIWFENIVR